VAVGPAEGSGEILAERWHGRSWSSRAIPDPQGPLASVLNGVSCPSATACIVVGSFNQTANGSPLPLAESWDGNHWTVASPPAPDGAATGQLDAVSCTSSTQCIAVGRFSTTVDGLPSELVELWSNGNWKIEATPQ